MWHMTLCLLGVGTMGSILSYFMEYIINSIMHYVETYFTILFRGSGFNIESPLNIYI